MVQTVVESRLKAILNHKDGAAENVQWRLGTLVEAIEENNRHSSSVVEMTTK